MTLTEFLTARLDEDEATAKRAEKKRRGPWWSFRFLVNNARPGKSGRMTPTARDRGSVCQAIDDHVAEHIARHDPARVLREVEAKRKILAEHPVDAELLAWSLAATEVVAGRQAPLSWCQRCWTEIPDAREDEDQCARVDWPCPTLRALALPYCDHPDYGPAWA